MIINDDKQLAKIAINNSLLKEYTVGINKRVVYMNDGDEFQIQFFNPDTEVIAASISIDGKQLPQKLIIQPGERIWLERFFDENRKFKFSTYVVDNPDKNPNVKDAIKNNGEIEIRFYYESKPKNVSITKPLYGWEHDPYINKPITTYPYPFSTTSTSTDIVGHIFGHRDFVENGNYSNKTATDSDLLKYSYSESCDSNGISKTTSIETIPTCCAANSVCVNDNIKPTSIETGRINQGSVSEQKLENIYKSFAPLYFHREVIKILPMSMKAYNSKDLNKIYCPECGRKLKPKYKFCPYCGEKLD